MQRGHHVRKRDRYAVRNQTWQHGASGITDALLFAEKREKKKKEEKKSYPEPYRPAREKTPYNIWL